MYCAVYWVKKKRKKSFYLLKESHMTAEEAKSTDIQKFKLQDNLVTIEF